MTLSELLTVLHDLFDTPTSFDADAQLTDYIKDSIDAGELVAVLRDKTGKDLQLEAYKEAWTPRQILDVTNR